MKKTELNDVGIGDILEFNGTNRVLKGKLVRVIDIDRKGEENTFYVKPYGPDPFEIDGKPFNRFWVSYKSVSRDGYTKTREYELREKRHEYFRDRCAFEKDYVRKLISEEFSMEEIARILDIGIWKVQTYRE